MQELNLTDQRATFPKGTQRAFLENVQEKLSVQEMARICECSERTIRDWRREKFTMSASAAYKLSARSGTPVPSTISIIPAYAHVSEAGKKGGAAVIEKYGKIPGDPAYRIEQWKKWWYTEGKYSTSFSNQPFPVQTPDKSIRLAELVGIAMGDGGLSTYQFIISLNTTDDAEYIEFVTKLLEELFNITPSIYPSKSANVTDIVISRKLIVEYLHGLGLPIGDKIRQRVDIPDWIKANPEFVVACLRGLVDTDGCIVIHSYISKGKRYYYKKLAFTSASPTLIDSAHKMFTELGFKARISRDGRNVCLDSKAAMARYFKIIGTSNSKHLKRYESDVG